ncbi:MAG: hypothetical protein N2Z74_05485 [Syntrophales bacterium]|nr:hypothetical protein [Syntrophales bacterium]
MYKIFAILLILSITAAVPVVVSSDGTAERPRMIKEQASKGTVKKQPVRETRMRATGIVKEITAETVKIERTPTGETMEFSLEKPLVGVEVGNHVVVSYILKDERNIAKRVTKVHQKKKVVVPPEKTLPAPAKSP